MALLYRAMIEENGFPKIGRSPRMLGVRLSIDIDVEQIPLDLLDEQGSLRSSVEQSNSPTIVEVAIRNNKGMSTSLSIAALPAFRKPQEFGGTGKDPLWQIDDCQILGEIEAVQDSPTHVSIMPRRTILLEKYETAIANTRNDWEKVL